jgi:NAD(P)H dehydrogenase (quinone)
MLLVGSLFLAAASQAHAQMQSTKILVVYYSKTGHTAALAKAVAEGAKKVRAAGVTLKTVTEVKCDELLAADALIVGSPVYWSNMAAEVKSFFDRWSTECKVLPPDFQMKDKVGAAFVTAGGVSSGKEVTLLTILAAMIGNRMIVLSEGEALGAAATTGEGKLPLDNKDLEDGRRLGERVAQVALTLKRGRR